ncbi:hypothetical protein BDA99DRAFT_562904 [Phascolomyces articulosus]|uniref:Uncharacterized protein n=1 Tax=Phascolomyces articulosus TaxID=60185 RepID=A0AAD5PB62_9FUNG|nr:hypothetical protein BDA99DRAFT_562904 [Phascolomyces articulosus]
MGSSPVERSFSSNISHSDNSASSPNWLIHDSDEDGFGLTLLFSSENATLKKHVTNNKDNKVSVSDHGYKERVGQMRHEHQETTIAAEEQVVPEKNQEQFIRRGTVVDNHPTIQQQMKIISQIEAYDETIQRLDQEYHDLANNQFLQPPQYD